MTIPDGSWPRQITNLEHVKSVSHSKQGDGQVECTKARTEKNLKNV